MSSQAIRMFREYSRNTDSTTSRDKPPILITEALKYCADNDMLTEERRKTETWVEDHARYSDWTIRARTTRFHDGRVEPAV
jgi:hypothetical protein